MNKYNNLTEEQLSFELRNFYNSPSPFNDHIVNCRKIINRQVKSNSDSVYSKRNHIHFIVDDINTRKCHIEYHFIGEPERHAHKHFINNLPLLIRRSMQNDFINNTFDISGFKSKSRYKDFLKRNVCHPNDFKNESRHDVLLKDFQTICELPIQFSDVVKYYEYIQGSQLYSYPIIIDFPNHYSWASPIKISNTDNKEEE